MFLLQLYNGCDIIKNMILTVKREDYKMNIEILHMIEGAKKAKGVTVVIDVFRAFSVEAYFFCKRCKRDNSRGGQGYCI